MSFSNLLALKEKNNVYWEQPPDAFYKKGVLKNFAKLTGKHLFQGLFLNKVTKKETLAQAFSCEFCEIFKNTFFTKQLWTTASDICFTLES